MSDETKIENPPAFPQPEREIRTWARAVPTEDDHMRMMYGGAEVNKNGMSLRDYFAAKAMQALLTFGTKVEVISAGDDLGKVFARRAYEMADSMLAERNKPSAPQHNIKKERSKQQ